MADEEGLEKQEAGAEPWMLTYGDMVTLLLTFFVLLFAFATIDVQKGIFQKGQIWGWR